MTPYDFENLIVRLLIKMGYGTLKQNESAVTQKSGDEGIDGIVSADKFGFDSIYIQAKKWRSDTTVGKTRDTKIFRRVGGTGCNKGDFYHDGTLFKRSNSFCGKAAAPKNCFG